jgi:hypothetical protein
MWKLRPTQLRSPLAFGDAIDTGLNHLLETRDLAKAKFEFDIRWNTYREKDVAYSKSDLDEFLVEDDPGNTWLSLLRRGNILLEEFNEQIMPRIKDVVKVQLDQTAQNDMGDELVIKTDFICVWEDGRRILFDNKTSSMKYAEDSVRVSPQLAIYYETLKAEYSLDCAGYIVIPKRINKIKTPRVKIEVIIDNIDPETTAKTLESYDEVLRQIKAANFIQNKQSCISVFGKCDFYNYCHQGDLAGLIEKKEK